MFQHTYQDNIKAMQAILNQDTIIQNTYYFMSHDKNLARYFEQAVHYALNRGDRDVMLFNNWYFVVKENQTVNQLYQLLINTLMVNYLDKDSQTLAKPCRIFPDHGGETLMRLLGFYPLIKLITSHIQQIEYINKHYSPESLEILEKQRQRKLASTNNIFSRTKFLEDEQFIDYQLRNAYIEKIKDEFEQTQDELYSNMNLLGSALQNDPTLGNDLIFNMGCQYWDDQRIQKKESDQKMKDQIGSVLTSLANGLTPKE